MTKQSGFFVKEFNAYSYKLIEMKADKKGTPEILGSKICKKQGFFLLSL